MAIKSKNSLIFIILFTFLLASPLRCGSWSYAAEVKTQYPPIDWRDSVSQEDYLQAPDGHWEMVPQLAPFAFDELIYSWRAKLQQGQGFRLYLRVAFADGVISPWLYAGYWGEGPPVGHRTNPTFEFGKVAMDQLLLTRKASHYQFKVVSKGKQPLSGPPSLQVIATDNHPSEKLHRQYQPVYGKVAYREKIFDLPLRLQQDSKGKPLPDRCQSAAVACAMEYFGLSLPLEEVIRYTNDPEYDYPGIWPRTIGAAIQFGFEAYIDRFRDWTAVKVALSQNKIILCSITMPRGDSYISPPYPSIGPHIIALNGVTEDGRVIVTDSAIRDNNGGYLSQWKREDIEKIWMRNKGGVGMVICPPENFKPKPVKNLPPFPRKIAAKAN